MVLEELKMNFQLWDEIIRMNINGYVSNYVEKYTYMNILIEEQSFRPCKLDYLISTSYDKNYHIFFLFDSKHEYEDCYLYFWP